MFCRNCGFQFSDNEKECPKCGTPILSGSTDSNESPEVSSPVSEAKPKKSKAGIIVLICVLATVLVAAAVVVVLMLGNKFSKKQYVEEVEAYLDYIADEENDVSEFLSNMYFGGEFGQYYKGSDAAKLHEILLKANFSSNGNDEPDIGYDYYGYGKGRYDWEDYTEDALIGDFYNALEDVYGDWELKYEIKDTAKLSKGRTRNLQDELKNIIENYEDLTFELDSEKDQGEFEEFIESMEKLKVKSAYKVEVEIEIDGKKNSYEETVDFIVAEIGKEWVILEGPGFQDFLDA
ncbi:MAG: zinc ribbon domain-containing protein [Ruminococcaceae bacterium]|nr:zinc ribbon domain-containing protein [Oscillospiraceae bacterium]